MRKVSIEEVRKMPLDELIALDPRHVSIALPEDDRGEYFEILEEARDNYADQPSPSLIQRSKRRKGVYEDVEKIGTEAGLDGTEKQALIGLYKKTSTPETSQQELLEQLAVDLVLKKVTR